MLLVNTINDLEDFDHVLVVMNFPDDLRTVIKSPVTYYRLRFKPIFLFGTCIRLRRIIRKEKPDVIHCHLFWSTIAGRISKQKKTKFFFTLHGMMGTRLFEHNTLYRWLEKITLSPRQHLIAVSKTVLDDYTRVIPFKGRTHVIYNYVPEIFFRNRKNDFYFNGEFKMVAVGSLKEIKNHRLLIKALALLNKNIVLDIYGEGKLKEELTALIKDSNTKVRIKENVKKLETILPSYDLFVMPSFSEGNSIALLEAMACRMPLLLSDIPSFREVTNNKAAYFDKLDEKDLVEKIESLFLNSTLRQQIADDNFRIASEKATRDKFIWELSFAYTSD